MDLLASTFKEKKPHMDCIRIVQNVFTHSLPKLAALNMHSSYFPPLFCPCFHTNETFAFVL